MSVHAALSSDTDPLSRLLALAEPLHNKHDLTLRQLVAVHASLCHALLLPAAHEPPDEENEMHTLDTALLALLSHNEHGRRLLQHGTDDQKLLVMQYVLYPFDALHGLAVVVLPYILATSDERSAATEDLREAMLDAAFALRTAPSSSQWLGSCLEQCGIELGETGATSTASLHSFATACRVLVRLHEYSGPTEQNLIRKTCHEKVLQGMALASSSGLGSEIDPLSYLKPITAWLLPLLYEEPWNQNVGHTKELWTSLWEVGKRTKASTSLDGSTSYLVVSAILCGILPSLVTHELPCTQAGYQSRIPAQQPMLWDFIHVSLSQGIDTFRQEFSGAQLKERLTREQILRRRGLYLLRLIVEGSSQQSIIWKKYLLCFEALEMETQQNLVDQVWDTVAELCAAAMTTAATATTGAPPELQKDELPHMTWDWISTLLSRILLSDAPQLRKLGLYRFLNGQAGIRVSPQADDEVSTKEKAAKKKKKLSVKGKKTEKVAAPLSLVSPGFVLKVVIPSFDSLGGVVGTNIHFDENGKTQVDDVEMRFKDFLHSYVVCLQGDASRISQLIRGILGQDAVCGLRTKTAVQVYATVAESLRDVDTNVRVSMDTYLLEIAIHSFQYLFGTGSVVMSYREELLTSFASILACSSWEGTSDPRTLLRVLALYPISSPQQLSGQQCETDVIRSNPSFQALQTWLQDLGETAEWASTVGASCASAFVSGQLLPWEGEWDPASGGTEIEQSMGASIALLCALAGTSQTTATASSLLWPAIHKVLSCCPQEPHWLNADRATRGLILLENGCRLELLSGIGNGDLLVDEQSQQMIPPPPNIEAILQNAIRFLLHHIRAVVSIQDSDSFDHGSGSLRSGLTGRVSSTFATLISQLQIFRSAYPSSLAVAAASNELLKRSINALLDKNSGESDLLPQMALTYATLSCGTEPDKSTSVFSVCRCILDLTFSGRGLSRTYAQTARSVFQYAKWGALSCLLPFLRKQTPDSREEINSLLTELFTVAFDSVQATPVGALLPLFNCVVDGAKCWLDYPGVRRSTEDILTQNLRRISDTLFAVLKESSSTRDEVYMVDEMSALLFQPRLLLFENDRISGEGYDESDIPIRGTFRALMKLAGTKRSHISKVVMSRISVAWMPNEDIDPDCAGMAAIPYRNDIVDLLVHKEVKMGESSLHQSREETRNRKNGFLELPSGTDDFSVVRGFVLLFIGRLPNTDDGLSRRTLTDLLHFVILRLLNDFCLSESNAGPTIMGGSIDYCLRMRAWQALCVLSRFVTEEIVRDVCNKAFLCLAPNLHGEIRYFVEIFIIQCARSHPATFGQTLVEELRRHDLSVQHVSSLMVITGNLVVGRYKLDFFRQLEASRDLDVTRLDEILAGVIPWLGSTQGFSRAIAQLLVHELVPMVVDVDTDGGAGSDWFLRSIYAFLENNPEMKRLRKKQTKAFEKFDVDQTCTPEGILRIPVDEGNEASPEHLVDALKTCLEQVYQEAHKNDRPTWKQIDDMLKTENSPESIGSERQLENSLVNFQRKIIPIDMLDLALEESRELRLRNASGRKKQNLVVCATLIEKAPNLAGLSRSAEIFAADRLVLPDKNVCRMDIFKSISVGAEQWISIEECKEEALLSWLRKQKADGFTIVGVEQTSSSVSISELKFPQKTVLLLGKEKEGIPVEYLQTVDICVEIPQFGIIRSLNVHVSGALAMWEFTKQQQSLGSVRD